MINYGLNWMGPARLDFYEKHGKNWAAGRIDMRGGDLGPYGSAISVPIIDIESWRLLNNWLLSYRTDVPDYDVLNTFQNQTGHKITFFKHETN